MHTIEPEKEAASVLADELLAVRCQLGEPDALDALVDRWHTPLWQFVRRMLNDDETAADTLQDTWLRILRAMPALRDPSRLRSWLFGIARRAVMDRLRSAYGESLEVGVDVDTLPARDDLDEFAAHIDAVHETMAALPLRAREVLALFYLQELTLQQIAEVLALPVGTVKSRLFTARVLLRRALTDQGWPP